MCIRDSGRDGFRRIEEGSHAVGAVAGVEVTAQGIGDRQVTGQPLRGRCRVAEQGGHGAAIVKEIVVIRVKLQRLGGDGAQLGVVAVVLELLQLLFEGGPVLFQIVEDVVADGIPQFASGGVGHRAVVGVQQRQRLCVMVVGSQQFGLHQENLGGAPVFGPRLLEESFGFGVILVLNGPFGIVQAALEAQVLRRSRGQGAPFGGIGVGQRAGYAGVFEELGGEAIAGVAAGGHGQLPEGVGVQVALGQQASAVGVQAGAFLKCGLAQGHHAGKRPLVGFEGQIGFEQQVPLAGGGQRTQSKPRCVHGLNAAEDQVGYIAQRGIAGKGATGQFGVPAGEQEGGVGAAIVERRHAARDAVLQLGAEFGLRRGIRERSHEAFHGRQLFLQVEEDRAAVDQCQRQAVGLGAGHEDEKLLGHDKVAGFGLLGLEGLDTQAALGSGGVHRRLGGEVVRQDDVLSLIHI